MSIFGVHTQGSGPLFGPKPLNSTQRHELFLYSTCDIRLSDMQHGSKKDSDMRHGYFLNSTCDKFENESVLLIQIGKQNVKIKYI